MPSTLILRRRISSVKNTKQITKAMELVSASKMRRAQDQAKLSRDYREMAYDLLARMSTINEVTSHPLFVKRKVKSRLYIIITSNSGLAGAYNSNVQRLLIKQATEDRRAGVKISIIAIGKQGAQFARRLEYVELKAVYPAFGDRPTPKDIRPLLNSVLAGYVKAEIDSVRLIYTEFKTNLLQQATALDLLPASKTDDTASKYKYDFTNFEPSVESVLENVSARLIEAQLWQALLESLASEHSMRMLAMKNATDNASDLIDDLTLEFNSLRQAGITQEIAEISSGVEALA